MDSGIIVRTITLEITDDERRKASKGRNCV